MSSYTSSDFDRDYAEMCRLSLPAKPDDLYEMVQWEMARSHKSFVEYWMQVQKHFNTSTPVEDAENYLQFAKEWIRIIEIHHTLEEEVQFPVWETYINADIDKDRKEHEKLFAALAPFKKYLNDVHASAKSWNAETARSLSNAFIPLLMRHFVDELYPLDAQVLRKSGLTEEKIAQTFRDVAARGKEIMDVFREVPVMIGHNGGASDWPPFPKEVVDKYAAIYEVHKGWWKYCAIPLNA